MPSIMQRLTVLILAIAGTWFGIWEGLIEPALPHHRFLLEDAIQICIGLCSGYYAIFLKFPKTVNIDQEEVGTARTIALGLIATGFTTLFLLPTIVNYDSITQDYFQFMIDLLGQPKPGEKWTFRTVVLYAMLIAPFVVSLFQATLCSALAGIFLFSRISSNYQKLLSSKSFFDDALGVSSILHSLLGIIFFFATV